MADEPKKKEDGLFAMFGRIFQDTSKAVTENLKQTAINTAVGAAVDTVGTFSSALQDGIVKGAYKDPGKIPKQFKNRNRGGYSYASRGATDEEDFTSYYYSPKSSGSNTNSATAVMREDARNPRIIPFDTEDEARRMVDKVLEEIDNSQLNACTVGKLYEMQEPKLPSNGMMFWKYGWNERDKPYLDVMEIKDSKSKHYGKWILKFPTPHVVVYT